MESSADQRFVNVLSSHELSPGELREVVVGSCRLVVGRLPSGEVVAFGAACPHEAAPLAQGTFRGGAIDCPRHHYMFDPRTGQNLFPLPIYPAWKRAQVGDLTLPTFPVTERNGQIAVAVGPECG